MFSNILIGVDRHDGGRDAVALARLWFADGAQLTLARVYVGDPYVWAGWVPPRICPAEAALGPRSLKVSDDRSPSQRAVCTP